MKFQERSYSSKVIRPKPLIHFDEESGIVVVATAWGDSEHAQKAIDEVVRYIQSAKSDVEVTSPFEFLTSTTNEVNYLRTALLISNEFLYRSVNQSEYNTGIEILVLFKRGKQLAWAQVGSPHLLIQRQNQSVQALSVSPDLGYNLERATMGPLPTDLLGVERQCHIHHGHVLIDEGDKLILLASSLISPVVWKNKSERLDLNSITEAMIQENIDQPFWLGIVGF